MTPRPGVFSGASLPLVAFLLPLAAGVLLEASPLSGQTPPGTIQVLPDTTVLQLTGDSLDFQAVQGDTINPEDTLPAVELPPIPASLPEGWETGVWQWDRDEILAAKALTLAELLEEIPGVTRLRGGDYGTPVSASAFGAGGGRIRVYRDGIEMLPLEGSVVDLARMGLGGLRSVRVVRSATDLIIELESVLAEGGQPYSLVEAGTGDLNSNLFRGTFSHPRALGGVVALAMERVDTRGPRGEEPGVSQGVWFRYARPLPWDGVLVFDYGSRSSEREGLYSPGSASRSDWSLRTRWNPFDGFVGDLYYGSSSIKTEEPDTLPFDPRSRTQAGAILSYDSPWLRASGHMRKLSGEGLPETTAHVQARTLMGRFGGLSGEMTWEDWAGKSVSRNRFQAWTSPVWGLSLFAEWGSGEWGLPYLPAVVPSPADQAPDPEDEMDDTEPVDSFPPVVPGPRFAEHTGTRYGARFNWRGFSLSGALLEVESDSLFLMGLPTDRSGGTQVGGIRKGFEAAARVPLYPHGFSLVGWWQKWDQADDVYEGSPDQDASTTLLPEAETPWRYLPSESYLASLSFHDTFYPTGNLEVWFDLGARGRSPMAVPLMEEVEMGGGEDVRLVPSMVPFYQSWFVRLQIRIVSVRAFIMWENFTVRQRNQDFPGRILPATRSLYGVRWTLWN